MVRVAHLTYPFLLLFAVQCVCVYVSLVGFWSCDTSAGQNRVSLHIQRVWRCWELVSVECVVALLFFPSYFLYLALLLWLCLLFSLVLIPSLFFSTIIFSIIIIIIVFFSFSSVASDYWPCLSILSRLFLFRLFCFSCGLILVFCLLTSPPPPRKDCQIKLSNIFQYSQDLRVPIFW